MKKGTRANVEGMPRKGRSDVAWYHTHGAGSIFYDVENFSKSDKRFSELNKVIGYLGTPSGAIKKYNPVTDEVTVIRSGTASDLESNSFL